MPKPFYERLKNYYDSVAKVLKGTAEVGSIFPNPSDVGGSRETIYAKFLKEHSPSKCNVFLGGFLFDANGNESNQLDVIITNDTSPKFDFHDNKEKAGKSFASVDGCIGVASIKSKLDKKELFNALMGLKSIPDKIPLEKNKVDPRLEYKAYDDWPFKIIYAHDGLTLETIENHLTDFYNEHPTPINKKPNLIHVAGKYAIIRARKGDMIKDKDGHTIISDGNSFAKEIQKPDAFALTKVIDELQKMVSVSNHIIFDYSYIIRSLQERYPLQ